MRVTLERAPQVLITAAIKLGFWSLQPHPVPEPLRPPKTRRGTIRPWNGPFKRLNRWWTRRLGLFHEQYLPLLHPLLQCAHLLLPFRDLPHHHCPLMCLFRERPLSLQMLPQCFLIFPLSDLLLPLLVTRPFTADLRKLLPPRHLDSGRLSNRPRRSHPPWRF